MNKLFVPFGHLSVSATGATGATDATQRYPAAVGVSPHAGSYRASTKPTSQIESSKNAPAKTEFFCRQILWYLDALILRYHTIFDNKVNSFTDSKSMITDSSKTLIELIHSFNDSVTNSIILNWLSLLVLRY